MIRNRGRKERFLPELYDLPSDPKCEKNVIADRPDAAREMHKLYYDFLVKAGIPDRHLRYLRTI